MEMTFSKKYHGSFQVSKEISVNILFNELPLGLQAKLSFMFDVFRIFRHLAKCHCNFGG